MSTIDRMRAFVYAVDLHIGNDDLQNLKPHSAIAVIETFQFVIWEEGVPEAVLRARVVERDLTRLLVLVTDLEGQARIGDALAWARVQLADRICDMSSKRTDLRVNRAIGDHKVEPASASVDATPWDQRAYRNEG